MTGEQIGQKATQIVAYLRSERKLPRGKQNIWLAVYNQAAHWGIANVDAIQIAHCASGA